ncbi:DMT family transporter [Oceanibacterium hippocampi]|uniref:Putative DMT superfamily transporter inner membrane protein n=1 Tax=Oceanibacterium hippocampi TaxID=745714 RepID=A0A1Y5TYH4_9PROT|nr:DMT family transporter [Oceanibacterium hippocampi]SLN75846.1 putative DMT superfamily transporter inner membrane protein [Oceanibacterium hippocampi]
MTPIAKPADPAQDPGARLLAYMLLGLTALFWAGNAISGRLAVGEVSPMTLTCVRWGVIILCFAIWLRRPLRAAWPVIRRDWLRISLMGTSGFTLFTALFYYAAHYTSAMNILILQGAIPVLVLLGARFLQGTAISFLQAVGMAITTVGVVLIATRGDLGALLSLRFNTGDLLMLAACVVHAGYTLSLRRKSGLDPMVLFFVMAAAGFVSSAPLLALEIQSGLARWPSPTGWALLAFVTIFPSAIGQVFFIRGIGLIGPGRAGLFINLVPVFGALLAVVILGETMAGFHVAALALVLGGIFLAEIRSRY